MVMQTRGNADLEPSGRSLVLVANRMNIFTHRHVAECLYIELSLQMYIDDGTTFHTHRHIQGDHRLRSYCVSVDDMQDNGIYLQKDVFYWVAFSTTHGTIVSK